MEKKGLSKKATVYTEASAERLGSRMKFSNSIERMTKTNQF